MRRVTFKKYRLTRVQHVKYGLVDSLERLEIQDYLLISLVSTMKKIPSDVHSLIRASNQINNHCKAVEDLVYNALDAGATSVAIRVNIQENTIQVIDNGCGISSKDFKLLGHKHMTSKYIDLPSLKSAPNKYGFRGQALSSLINVSRSVKLVSRHELSDITWMKSYEHGQEKQLEICNTRPSKGTTVEITGFLYNLNIQNRSKDTLQNLQSIKTLLEHMSLVHCGVSFSLRDDSRNEIIFKIHKTRDVPQTLSNLYNIENKKLQELQVEKNEYKVKAYISKSDNGISKQLIFLNGKFLSNSKLHKIVNKNLSKCIKGRSITKLKIKDRNTEETQIMQNNAPDYFIFMKCPYTDYELSNSPKQSLLEFKDWKQINKLLDKLIKFYNGDMTLKEVKKVEQNKVVNKPDNCSTREQVKKIMERILGTNTKKTAVVNLRNGIRGKQVKRKSKKSSRKAITEATNCKESKIKENLPGSSRNINYIINKPADTVIDKRDNLFDKSNDHNSNIIAINECLQNNGSNNASDSVRNNKHCKKIHNMKELDISNQVITEQNNIDKKINKEKQSRYKKNELLRKFKPTESTKKRCDKLHRKTIKMLNDIRKETLNKIHNENHVININKKHFNVSVRNQIDEIIIQKNKSKQPRAELINAKKKSVMSNYDLLQTILETQRYNKKNNIQEENITDNINYANDKTNNGCEKDPKQIAKVTRDFKIRKHKLPNKLSKNKHLKPTITYESHNYYARQSIHTKNNTSYQSHVQIHNAKRTFITKQSRDNFIMANEGLKGHLFKRKSFRTGFPTPIQAHIKNLFKQTSKLFNLKKQIMGATCESSYTIEFTESNRYRSSNDRVIMSDLSKNTRMYVDDRSQSVKMNNADIDNDVIVVNSSTRTLPKLINNSYTGHDENYNHWGFHGTYTIERTDKYINDTESLNQSKNGNRTVENNRNFIFVSKSQEHDQSDESIDPMNVCETILNSEEIIGREFETSFSNRPIPLPNSAMFDDVCTKENNKIEDIFEDQHLVTGYHNAAEVSDHFELPHNTINEASVLSNAKNNLKKHNDCQNVVSQASHHFDRPNDQGAINEANDLSDPDKKTIDLYYNRNIWQRDDYRNLNGLNIGDFNIVNRPYFVPKGLSPIFQNCKTKNACESNLSKDYYEKEIINNFAKNVRNNAVVFEPRIQDAQEVNTKAIDKVNIKLVKDKAALKFDGDSLKYAEVFGQIDEKFIVATMKERGTGRLPEYLVLFDQHAVHERIRLEDNLKDYFQENQWKAVPIDEITLKLSKDDVLYLHNFQDKFQQLGLQWTVVNYDEISMRAIPEAILGKSLRQVEKVMKAVRSLITEEINIIKMQGGCVSLYPKSIMDLVFSEACRYAIKFGDKLSKAECIELLKTLSGCKTPFQCAHGRPVMAVVMEFKPISVEYKININKIIEWKKNKLNK